MCEGLAIRKEGNLRQLHLCTSDDPSIKHGIKNGIYLLVDVVNEC